MNQKAVTIQVPASTSNLGVGFDSMGLALGRYLQVDAQESDSWQFTFQSPNLDGLPTDDGNLIYKVAAQTAEAAGCHLPACRIKVRSQIPLARGLGSSGAAIIGGIELADQMLDLRLSTEDKFRLALGHESHGDNLGASLCGGLVLTHGIGADVPVLQSIGVPEVDLVALVPRRELKTTEARRILPDTLAFQAAVHGSSAANMLVAAIMRNDWELAGRMMAEDVFHQPYRLSLVPELQTVIDEACRSGAYGAALSGAGPSVMAFTPSGEAIAIADTLGRRFPDDDVFAISPDTAGVTSHIKTPSIL